MLADEAGARGLVCLGYPFHPPGRPERLRTAHLESLRTPDADRAGHARPVRDTGRGRRLSALARRSGLHWIEDGDHSLAPRKASGRTRLEAQAEAIARVAEFVAAL